MSIATWTVEPTNVCLVSLCLKQSYAVFPFVHLTDAISRVAPTSYNNEVMLNTYLLILGKRCR